MKLKRYINFINENSGIKSTKELNNLKEIVNNIKNEKDINTAIEILLKFKSDDRETEKSYIGNFVVTKDMVKDGRFIEGVIPTSINGSFKCINTKLTSLEGGPKYVTGNFICRRNQLISLKGGPKEIFGYFDCSYNKLTTLEGGPKYVDNRFDCNNNQLTSLEGGPKEVGGDFDCHNNRLTSLEGGPKEVGGDFDCNNNQLTNLEHGPTEVSGYFFCYDNKNDLILEKDFIKSGNHKGDYWTGLFRYMISKNIELTRVEGWPDVFINSLEPKYKNILQSAKGISKFKL